MSPLSALLRRNLALWTGRSTLPEQVERDFAARCRDVFDHHARIVSAVVLAMTLVWWPSDRFVFREVPELLSQMHRWRIGIALASGLFVVLPRPPIIRRYIFWIFCISTSACCFTAGSTAAMLGGPNTPWLHMLYIMPLATITLPLPLGQRALLTGLVATVTVGGYFVPHPEHLASPFVIMVWSFMFCVCLLSVWFGNGQYLLSRENFRQAQELSEHGRLLETRVVERTRELRRLVAHVETAREAERARIARELHDELGQELSALRFALGFARKRYAADPAAISTNLSDLENLIKRTTITTRNLVADLRPRVLDELGFEAAARWLIERTQQRSELACRLKIVNGGVLNNLHGDVATAAFRVLQEALTNTVRHAQAHNIEVELQAHDDVLELCIADDGIGVAAGQAHLSHSGGHFGLISMRERGHALGGNVEVNERQGGGTEVRCRLPLVPPAEDLREEPQTLERSP